MISKNLKKIAIFSLACTALNLGCDEMVYDQAYQKDRDNFVNKYARNMVTHPNAVIAKDQNLSKYVLDEGDIKFIPLKEAKILDEMPNHHEITGDNHLLVIDEQKGDTLGFNYPMHKYRNKIKDFDLTR